MIDRNNKKAFAKVALPDGEGKKLTAKQLIDILKVVLKQENHNTIMTDEYRGYDPLSKNGFIHLRVDHTKAFSDNHGTYDYRSR